jgi:hypothetical protein
VNTTVPRTCTEIGPGGERIPGLTLTTQRDRPAYVLLGEPGAGKTTAFAEEARAAGCEAVSARDFVVFDRPEWRNWTLFIDGLDEIRAGSTNSHTPLDAIRRKIDALGRPPFRISCREADWHGAGDRDSLDRIAPGGRVAILHLDDLDTGQIETLLRENHGEPDPKGFIDCARQRRLDSLLGNPQNLRMLAEAVRQGWPDGLAETYALACQRLAEESNRGHRDAWRQTGIATDDVLFAAGHGCAVQLLAGVAGFALDPAVADKNHPAFDAIGLTGTPALNRALGSRLFESRTRNEQREPAHRSIAEYLGARFLAKRIEREGMPLGRVLALMSAGDGGIVADLRGLHAWLAAHCLSARDGLIEHDPLGIVLYGDIRVFGVADKRRLLEALGREAKRYPWFRASDWSAPPFGALAGTDLREDFDNILTAPDRTEAHESLVDCVLEAIGHGEPLPQLGEALLSVARDDSHWAVNRKSAVTAYIHANNDSPGPLLNLLDDIRAGRVADGDDEIAGLLLRHLYPVHLSASRVVAYLHPARTPSLIGNYLWFREHQLVERTDAQDFPALLNGVAADLARLRPLPDEYHFNRFAGELLTRGLAIAGESAPAEVLWNWLGIGLDEHAHGRLDREHKERIAAWLAGRPEIYRALLEQALLQCANGPEPLHCLFRAEHRFYGADLPAGVDEWCFERAAMSGEVLRRHLFDKAAIALLRRLDYTPALLEALLSVAVRHPVLQENVDGWLKSEPEEWRRDDAQRKVQRKEKEQARITEWVDHFRKHQAAIENGTAPPAVMHDLAKIYFGRFREAEGDKPLDRLQSFFGKDAGITLAALTGLRRTLTRADLPSVAEIVDLHIDGRHHFIAEACLAGAEELARDGSEAILTLPGEVQARLVAFRLTHDYDDTPSWFLTLVERRPATVADALIRYGKATFKAHKENVPGIYALAHDDAYAEVARHAALALLSAYPLRWKRENLNELATLLVAANKHSNRDELRHLIETKLSRSSLDAAQRGQWLAAGLLLDPVRYELPLDHYVGTSPSRAFLIAGFFGSRTGRARGLPELGESAMSLLIRLVGPHTSPERPTGAHWVSPAMEAAEFVRGLISRLGASPTDFATAALSDLIANKALHAWQNELRHHRENQRIVSREAHFRRASATEVVRTLANAEPANAADLHALLVQHLRDMARDDRDGSTTGYRRYWNVDSCGRPETPRPENDCRDRLLELLRERLRPLAVDAQPESEYRENKRADIRVFFSGDSGGFNVPIEIKRNSHPDLWSALRQQLIAHYVRDPAAGGYGIYLVFWFGGTGMPTAADGGKPPRDAPELAERLTATLDIEQQRRIAILVMDCTMA